MRLRLFVDTSAWLALNDKDDWHHEEATAKAGEIKRLKADLFTSEYVFDETITVIRYMVSHRAAVLFGDSVMRSGPVASMDVSGGERLAAWEIFKKYADKDFSFTDCVSFALMKKAGIDTAFAFDSHFRQMGFRIF